MATIEKIELRMVDLMPKVKRTDAIQSFVSQETPIITIIDSDGAVGTGYTYTIGTGGPSVMKLIERTLGPALIGRDAAEIERIWRDLMFLTHATTSRRDHGAGAGRNRHGPLGSALSQSGAAASHHGRRRARLAAALHDGRRVAAHRDVGAGRGRAAREGSRLRRLEDQDRPAARVGGCRAPARRARGVRSGFEIMTDANQLFTVDEAIRRARHYEEIDIAWFEEPLPADDLGGHVRLARSTSIPVAVGESLYSPLHFREYMQAGACSIVQVDVARIGGVTPWLKVAHIAEAFNMPVCPHFLMELHVGLCCAVPNARWVEYIPQLDDITGKTCAS